MSKLFVVSELFYPDEVSTAFVMTKIVNKLAEKYSNLEVICSESSYGNNVLKSENYFLNKSVKRTGIKSFSGSKNNLFLRTIRFFSISFKMFFVLLKKVTRHDKVVIVTNPAPIIVLASLVKILKGNKLDIIVHDVFPENTIPAGIFKDSNSLLYRLFLKVFNISYSNADKLFVVGRDMGEIIKEKIVKKNESKIIVIENWAETNDVFPKFNTPINEKIIFQFAGNLGRVQGLQELLLIINEIQNPILEFHFVGEGAVKEDLQNFVKKHFLKNVFFKPGFKREDQTEVLNDCDICIVTLSKGMYGLGVPSKSYNIMAAGKPILYIGDANSEIDLVIKEHKNGFSFNNFDMLKKFLSEIKIEDKTILNAKGRISRSLAETIYSEKHILNKYKDII